MEEHAEVVRDDLKMVSRSKSEHQFQSRRPEANAFATNASKAGSGGPQSKALPVSKEANMTTELKSRKLQVTLTISTSGIVRRGKTQRRSF